MRRTYPERRKPVALSISSEYMGRESVRWGRDLEGWVLSYLARNGIPSYFEDRLGEERLRINFQSLWRQKFFVLKANAEFPYFEFI